MNKKTLLLVEDEVFIRELYHRRLLSAGYNVLVAMDGLEGLELAKSKPDLVLLDIMLPKLNGIEVLKKLSSASKTKDIPVVLLTNLGQESIIREAFSLGARGYFVKMRVTPNEITDKVKIFLDNPNYTMDISDFDFD